MTTASEQYRGLPEASGEGAGRILIVSPVRLLRDELSSILERRLSVRSVLAVANAEAALLALSHFEPTLILLDVGTEDGLLAARRLADAVHGLQILGFAARVQDHDVLAYARAGVTSFVPCEASTQDLFDAIEHTGRGELLCSPRVAAALFRHLAALTRVPKAEPDSEKLTVREREIVGFIDEGKSNKEIARHLSIEVSTVKNHVHNILEKLQVARRDQAAARARQVRPKHDGSALPGM
ncbi:LuxR C-terminal-related transcriptional regulator [Paraburkholderia sp. 32]|uniref:LuxR C-terminal-related transcriptional regulator n=1 Tax=Paraburkholderia sp. 32 TaxID=2991057 RepID=UPI003D23FB0F